MSRHYKQHVYRTKSQERVVEKTEPCQNAPEPIVVEKDFDVVHCSTVGNKHWMFDQRLRDVVNQFAHFLI